jgi:hypothetical protein
VIIYPNRQQRLQVSFLMLIFVYTATRPRALVYVARNVKEYKSCPVRDKDNNKDLDIDNNKNNKIDINKDKDKDNVKNNKINNKEDSNKDIVKNNNINDKIVKAFLRHLNSIKLVKTLCYKNVNLLLLPNPTRTHNLLALEIDLCYTKGHQRQAKRLVIYLNFFATTC